MRVWVDIDNPPQARYLLSVARYLERIGHQVLITARAYGDTFAILRSEGVAFEAIGAHPGAGLPRKLHGLAQRARQLIGYLNRTQPPVDLVVTASRSAALAARRLAIPSFVIADYEYADVLVYAAAGSYIVHPDLIRPQAFGRRGLRKSRTLPFQGIKEDLSFCGIDLRAIPPHEFAGTNDSVRILVRPPAEQSHYYRKTSHDLALQVLRYLSGSGATVIFSPRDERQIDYLERVSHWLREPIVLREPVNFISLLKGIDAVVSAGGTMLREAAFLGIPAYSVFGGTIGAVDHYLASIGRLVILESAADFSRIQLAHNSSIAPLREGSEVMAKVVATILAHARVSSR